MNKSVKTFDEVDHQNTPEEHLQSDAHMIFTVWEQPLDPVAYKHWHKKAEIQFSLSGNALAWFVLLHESNKKDWSASVSASRKHFYTQKIIFMHERKLTLQQWKKLKSYVTEAWFSKNSWKKLLQWNCCIY